MKISYIEKYDLFCQREVATWLETNLKVMTNFQVTEGSNIHPVTLMNNCMASAISPSFNQGKRYLACSERNNGKTFLAACLSMQLLFQGNQDIIYVTATSSSTDDFKGYVNTFFEGNPILKEFLEEQTHNAVTICYYKDPEKLKYYSKEEFKKLGNKPKNIVLEKRHLLFLVARPFSCAMRHGYLIVDEPDNIEDEKILKQLDTIPYGNGGSLCLFIGTQSKLKGNIEKLKRQILRGNIDYYYWEKRFDF